MGKRISRPRPKTLVNTDLFTADATLTTTTFIELGRYTVPAGAAINAGYGRLGGQNAAQGRIYASIIDDTAGDATAEVGTLRLDLHDPNDRVERTLWEGRTESVLTSATDRRQQFPFPEVPVRVGEGWKLVLKMKGDAVDTVQYDFSVIRFDATLWDVREF